MIGESNVWNCPDTVAELDEKQPPDNNRIGTNTFLNQYFALTPDLDSMLLAWARKIVLQHNPPLSRLRDFAFIRPLGAEAVEKVGAQFCKRKFGQSDSSLRKLAEYPSDNI